MDLLYGFGWAEVIVVAACFIWDLFLTLNLLIISVFCISILSGNPNTKEDNFLSTVHRFSDFFCKSCTDNYRPYIESSGIRLPHREV